MPRVFFVGGVLTIQLLLINIQDYSDYRFLLVWILVACLFSDFCPFHAACVHCIQFIIFHCAFNICKTVVMTPLLSNTDNWYLLSFLVSLARNLFLFFVCFCFVCLNQFIGCLKEPVFGFTFFCLVFLCKKFFHFDLYYFFCMLNLICSSFF